MELVRALAIGLGSLLTIVATIPYMIEVARGTTRPRLLTWATWCVVLAIGSAAAFVAGQIPAALLMLCTSIQSGIVLVLGYKHGNRSYDNLDVICLCGAIVGLVLWLVLKNPVVAILSTVVIDFASTIPTFKQSWLQPYNETWSTYALFALSDGIILFVSNPHVLAAFIYPLFVLVVDLALTLLVLASPHRGDLWSQPQP